MPQGPLRIQTKETLIKSVFAELTARNLLIFQDVENQIWIKSVLP